MPAAYVPIVVPASTVSARLRGSLWGVLTTPLSLGVLSDRDYGLMMAALPEEPLVRVCVFVFACVRVWQGILLQMVEHRQMLTESQGQS